MIINYLTFSITIYISRKVFDKYFIGIWAEGSAFWLQIKIKGFEFPKFLNKKLHNIKIYC